MRWEAGQRAVTISVGELANFEAVPSSPRRGLSAVWRAAVGSAAHRQVQSEAPADPATRRWSEVPIEATAVTGRWQITIQGRLDLVEDRPAGRYLIEFKTVATRLPLDEADLRAAYPAYFHQLAIYLALARRRPLSLSGEASSSAQPNALCGELWFEGLSDGFRQQVPMGTEAAESIFAERLAALEPFLQARWSILQKRQSWQPQPAFHRLRDGQAEALKALRESAEKSGRRVTLFEAPTGFGKTGIALEEALRRLKDGDISRVLYLTGKSTGQASAIRQLAAMSPPGTGLRTFQLRSRAEHGRHCPHPCMGGRSCHHALLETPPGTLLRPWEALDHGPPDLGALAQLARSTNRCPYDWSRALLAFAEVWVCDYNYLFASQPAAVLTEVFDHSPATTLLIIDEAHNLPDRVASNFTFDLHAEALNALAERLPDGQFSSSSLSPAITSGSHRSSKASTLRALQRSLNALATLIRSERPTETLPDTVAYELIDALAEVAAALLQAPIDWEALGDDAETLFSLPAALRTLENAHLERLLWIPQRGHLRCSVLDAAPVIAETLRPYRHAILMSATLHPVAEFAERCGFPLDDVAHVTGHADWRQGAYRVALDRRVDTRLKHRADHYAQTAATLQRAALTAPAAAFFPSYAYAETIRTYLAALDPGLIVAMQPRVADLNGQLHFLDDSLGSAHLLFFVLGSGFSEGIDHLGGRVTRAVVVGPALPEVNAEQRARVAAMEHLGRSTAFAHTYLAPGLRKVNQALGRLVRAPGQRAEVLLHCARFGEPAFSSRLLPEYQPATVISNDRDLAAWWP